VMWLGNGSIGSVAKPFVLLEQLESERRGSQHLPMSELEPCRGRFRYLGQQLKCAGVHGALARDPRYALAHSCNCFFYQVGEGLGTDSLRRAYERFGLLKPAGPGGFSICWQDEVAGLALAPGYLDPDRLLPSQAIGYGLQVTPLMVARAYAGLATGVLPTLAVRRGVPRQHVTVAASEEALELVRSGMMDVLRAGSADNLELLAALGVCGKTGTAERTSKGDNNAWFAGYLPGLSPEGHQLAFCSVIYFVPDREYGGTTAGELAQEFVKQVMQSPDLSWRYLPR